MCAEVGELRFIGFSPRRFERKRDLRIAHIQSVEKRLTMNQRSVIDIERDLANTSKRVFAIFIVEYSYISRDQTTKWIQRQATYVSFDAALV